MLTNPSSSLSKPVGPIFKVRSEIVRNIIAKNYYKDKEKIGSSKGMPSALAIGSTQ